MKHDLMEQQRNYRESQNEIMLGIKKEFEGLQENLMQRQKLYEESQQNEMHALEGKICDIATVVQTLEKAGKSLMADLKNERGIIKDLQKNFSEEEKKIEGLKANIQALKEQINAREFEEVIPRKSLWQQFKESNVIVKVIVVAIPMSVIVAIYVIRRYYMSKQRAIAAESVKDNENDNLLPVPWRSLHKTLTEIPEIKDDLMQNITEELKNHDSTLNILLLGETGSGKSSFVNACFTALLQEGQYIARATAGAMTSDSVTLR
ncbi:uncharacterized protein LOC134228460, partial [Saccostrea cucullata]|uniref:uncharacterized protein LOC134228460 n=1 Tax=Saccostrea cuccullata TaxID=36930 RepID=UPI002ED5E1A9